MASRAPESLIPVDTLDSFRYWVTHRLAERRLPPSMTLPMPPGTVLGTASLGVALKRLHTNSDLTQRILAGLARSTHVELATGMEDGMFFKSAKILGGAALLKVHVDYTAEEIDDTDATYKSLFVVAGLKGEASVDLYTAWPMQGTIEGGLNSERALGTVLNASGNGENTLLTDTRLRLADALCVVSDVTDVLPRLRP